MDNFHKFDIRSSPRRIPFPAFDGGQVFRYTRELFFAGRVQQMSECRKKSTDEGDILKRGSRNVHSKSHIQVVHGVKGGWQQEGTEKVYK